MEVLRAALLLALLVPLPVLGLSCERHLEIHAAVRSAIASGADPDAVIAAIPDVVMQTLRDGERASADEIRRIQRGARRTVLLGGSRDVVEAAALFSCVAVRT